MTNPEKTRSTTLLQLTTCTKFWSYTRISLFQISLKISLLQHFWPRVSLLKAVLQVAKFLISWGESSLFLYQLALRRRRMRGLRRKIASLAFEDPYFRAFFKIFSRYFMKISDCQNRPKRPKLVLWKKSRNRSVIILFILILKRCTYSSSPKTKLFSPSFLINRIAHPTEWIFAFFCVKDFQLKKQLDVKNIKNKYYNITVL